MGVLSALGRQNQQFDIVTGISIGAFVGAVYTQQDYSGVEEWIRSFTSQDVASNLFVFPQMQQAGSMELQPSPSSTDNAGSSKAFNQFIAAFQKDGPSVQPLRTTFQQIFDYDKFQASPVQYACLAANLTENTAAVFSKQDMTRENAVDCLCASAAYFPAFSFVEMDGQYYGDGGYLNSELGIHAAAMGAEDLTIVALTDPQQNTPYLKEYCTLLIRPILKLAYFLNFEKPVLLQQIEQGRLETMKYLDLVPGYIYTFYPDDWILLDTLSEAAKDILKKNSITMTNDMLIDGITTLLGYKPGTLDNKYMCRTQAGLILECLGLISGIDYYKQHHLLDFLRQIINNLNAFEVRLDSLPQYELYQQMEMSGIRDLMIFFHSALQVWNGKLPAEFDIMKAKFGSVYDLALAWHILDKFSGLLKLF